MLTALKSTMLGGLLILALGSVPAFAQTPEFSTNDRTVFFKGELEPETLEKFFDIVSDLKPADIDRIVINSFGGDTRIGRELGRWVSRMALDVEVDEICFSSCANYVFPAGRHKIIRANAFVGWHGSETQSDILALSEPGRTGKELLKESLTSALRESGISDDDLQTVLKEQLEAFHISRTEEAEYFKSLGISNEFTLHGLRPEHLKNLEAGGKPGWTYSLEDMENLGLKNIQYLGDGPYHTSKPVTENVIVVDYIPLQQ